jgi:hypothetical protein
LSEVKAHPIRKRRRRWRNGFGISRLASGLSAAGRDDCLDIPVAAIRGIGKFDSVRNEPHSQAFGGFPVLLVIGARRSNKAVVMKIRVLAPEAALAGCWAG